MIVVWAMFPCMELQAPHTTCLLEAKTRWPCIRAKEKVILQPRVFLWLGYITLSLESVQDGMAEK